MSKVKDNWDEMTQDEILEEIHNENYGNIEQLRSDLEDAKDEIIRLLEDNIALREKRLEDLAEIGHLRSDNFELKKIIRNVEDKYDPRWTKLTD